MILNEIKAFYAVAVAGGFVRGADLLNRSQPTVSAQIRNLEQRYDVELFFRNRGQIGVLTPLGERLCQTARQLFSLEEDALAILSSAGKMKGGVLRLGAISPRWAAPIMAYSIKTYPALDLSLVIDNSRTLLNRLLEYGIDIVFVGAHIPNPLYHMRQVSKPEIVFLAEKDSRFAQRGTVTRTEFSTLSLLQRETGSETRALMDAALEEHQYRAAREIVCGNREGTVLSVEQGLGLSAISLEEIPSDARVSVVRAKDFRVYGEMHAICLKSRFHLPLIRETFEVIETNKAFARG
jgi:LysR family transcriptional regulator, low CO2-responsive transcriptional regulator